MRISIKCQKNIRRAEQQSAGVIFILRRFHDAEARFDNKRQNEQRLKQAAQKNNLDGAQFFTGKFNGTVGNLK